MPRLNRIWSIIISAAALNSWCAIHSERVQRNTNWVISEEHRFTLLVWAGTSRSPSWSTVVAKWFDSPSDDRAIAVPHYIIGKASPHPTAGERWGSDNTTSPSASVIAKDPSPSELIGIWNRAAVSNGSKIGMFDDADGLAVATPEQREKAKRLQDSPPSRVTITWTPKKNKKLPQ